MPSTALLLFVAQLALPSSAQSGPPQAIPQLNTWQAPPGSPYHEQAASVIADSGVAPDIAQAVQVAVDFERSNWATGSVHEDEFYCLPNNASHAKPGSCLKVEQHTNITMYTAAPNVALSRFIYQTETLNGSSVPATAFVLWPWLPQRFPNISGIPVVAWAHGTSGSSAECAPSHIQNLWYQYSAPFTLALQGYAVIGIDYAGLGINETADGTPIVHQWAANGAGANDIFYAVEAAQQAWPSELSEEFVVMGHSQGGGVAWASAERQYQKPVPGYLGSIAGSPLTSLMSFTQAPLAQIGSLLGLLAPTVASILPEFQLDDWLLPAGIQALALFQDLSGCQSTRIEAFGGPGASYAKPDWNDTWYLDTFSRLADAGGKPFAGPLLVLQGTQDDAVDVNGVTEAVNATCDAVHGADLEYVVFEGVTHVPVLYAGQQVWLRWIADRFSQIAAPGGCTRQHLSPALSVESYQKQPNYFLELPVYAYETA